MPLTPAQILTIASAGLKAFGAVSAGRAARSQFEFRAGLQTFNEKIARQQAEREREIAKLAEEDFRREQRRFLARRRAELGASGVAQSTGTPLIAVGSFAAEVERQAQRIRTLGETRAAALEQNAQLASLQRSLFQSAGRQEERRGFFRAGSSLLTGIAGII